MIRISQPVMPSSSAYDALLEGIWERGQLTNNGPLVRQLEQQLCDYLDVEHVVLVSSGTMALQLAFRACGLKNEVITTPFSYVATTSSLVWEGCTPVFADIHPETFCLDPKHLAACITPQTTGIVPTHIFGISCDAGQLLEIAAEHKLPIIFDAAHAFGSQRDGQSLLKLGTASALSLHATKLFHTGEGGAVITSDAGIAARVREMRNFGHGNDDIFHRSGINAKLSELHAAIGLCLLPDVENQIADRQKLAERYRLHLESLPGVSFQQRPAQMTHYNEAYFPLVTQSARQASVLIAAAARRDIELRRYCFPSLNTLPYLASRQSCPVSENLAGRTVCLPLYPGLSMRQQDAVLEICREVIC